jgi:hypothetical protein
LLCFFLPSFLRCYFFSFLRSSSARQSSQMEWNTKSVLMLVCVCVCVLAQLISSPIYAKVSTSGKVEVGRVMTISSSQQLCVLCCLCCGREVGGQTLSPPFLSLSLSLLQVKETALSKLLVGNSCNYCCGLILIL